MKLIAKWNQLKYIYQQIVVLPVIMGIEQLNIHILITGGAGFIGHHLVKRLLKDNQYKISVIDKEEPTHRLEGIHYYYEDISEIKNFDNWKSVDGIIHLASISRVITAQHNQLKTWKTNVEGTQSILSNCIRHNISPWIIYGSSREVYGEPTEFPVIEDHKLDPMNCYGISKLAAEGLIKQFSNQSGASCISLRFSNVYGSLHDHLDRVIPKFIQNAMNDEPLYLHCGDNSFDFTYISDTVNGILLTIEFLIQNPQNFSDSFNICTSKQTTLSELAKLIIRKTESTSQIIETPPRDYDVTQFCGGYDKAKKILGYVPKVNLTEGLDRLIELFGESRSTSAIMQEAIT